MTAADVIKAWSDRLPADGSYLLGAASAIQAGNPDLGSGVVVAYVEFAVSRNNDGDLNGRQCFASPGPAVSGRSLASPHPAALDGQAG